MLIILHTGIYTPVKRSQITNEHINKSSQNYTYGHYNFLFTTILAFSLFKNKVSYLNIFKMNFVQCHC